MRYVIFNITLFLLVTIPCLPQRKTTVAMIDLTVSNDLPAGITPVLSNLIRQEFVRSDNYDILDRGNMEAILKEQNFIMTDHCNNKECAVQVGQLLGVEKMLFGDLGGLGKKIIVNLQMVDVATGKIEKIESDAHVGAIEDLDGVVIKLARKISGISVEETREDYTVYVTSEPEGASIYVGEELRGTTPATLKFKSDSPVKIFIKAENYQDWYQEVRPKKDEKVMVSARLMAGKSGKQVSDKVMTADEYKVRYELYTFKKKSSGVAAGLSLYLGCFGAGHFYAGSYYRGVLVFGTSIAGTTIVIADPSDKKSKLAGTFLIVGAWLWDLIGAQFAVKSYNEKLQKELKLTVIPQPYKKGGQIGFSVIL